MRTHIQCPAALLNYMRCWAQTEPLPRLLMHARAEQACWQSNQGFQAKLHVVEAVLWGQHFHAG